MKSEQELNLEKWKKDAERRIKEMTKPKETDRNNRYGAWNTPRI